MMISGRDGDQSTGRGDRQYNDRFPGRGEGMMALPGMTKKVSAREKLSGRKFFSSSCDVKRKLMRR